MKERKRQELLREGTGITRRKLAEAVATASYCSWSGCLSGSAWRGTKWCRGVVVFGGRIETVEPPLNAGSHRQNGAPTGYERTGERTVKGVPELPSVGEFVVRLTSRCSGRTLDGDEIYRTEGKVFVVV